MYLIRCQACGTENPPDATFCSNCATRLDTATQARVTQRREEHAATGTRWSAVLAALVLLIAVIVIIALFVTHVL